MYLSEYIYNVQRPVSGEGSGFRYRFLAIFGMFTIVAGEAQRLTSVDVGKAADNGDQIVVRCHLEPCDGVAGIFGMKRHPLHDPL
jgi:hypothetical protein